MIVVDVVGSKRRQSMPSATKLPGATQAAQAPPRKASAAAAAPIVAAASEALSLTISLRYDKIEGLEVYGGVC